MVYNYKAVNLMDTKLSSFSYLSSKFLMSRNIIYSNILANERFCGVCQSAKTLPVGGTACIMHVDNSDVESVISIKIN